MKVIHSVHPEDFKAYQTAQIRERFLLDGIVSPGKIELVYTHYDRMIVGGASPLETTLDLPNYANLRAEYFLERREIGIINVAGNGTVTADGVTYNVNKLDCLYIGKGTKNVKFASVNAEEPAVYFILSSPAHMTYPTALMTNEDAIKVNAGAAETANQRTINKYIFLEGIRSCQLVMGLTILEPGSIWNTMPPHVHDRRMEAYFYFDVPEGNKIVHYMGEGSETRHIMMNNHEAVVSPPWSIHSGSGTANYKFIWGMAGENQDYTDMDAIAVPDLR
ncbi:5-dehydro-4-deoxy-D-glucuronate isomerase [Mucilaginibacter myungsuensis]|uniref:4-deoxy-L-threo-5-hexosulose-uronate ketol-isomerase n=1 Tax=Mucilaginibacter myungsuensis TaxID=649104 RepID=A0A929KY17_9SPHI|nr:5-dehydro-4-deoxy-D-glucuronate isomerase [Mucilaginibacter myungsuensis]MBE9662620.1 5-dehydro-4-deoxy-D-glucuronate isomerase [Mucilaginibacter myungsuensis]MDN3598040.1 5-dehydro-4-deoxy-D-glucuronate isomerase [Mucilaginibacter myungsuensis]